MLAVELMERFEVVRVLGRRAHAHVYVARDRATRRLLALKVLERAFVQQLLQTGRLREARALADARPPGVVPVAAVGCTCDRGGYVATELLEGRSLEARLARGPLSCADAVLFCLHVAMALTEARDRGVLHGAVKPSNVFVVPDPSLPRGERALLGDFGTASLGRRVLTPRADVGDLGSLLHELLTGRRYAGESVAELIASGLAVAIAVLIARCARDLAIEDTVADLAMIAATGGFDADPTEGKLPLRAPPRAAAAAVAPRLAAFELTSAFALIEPAELDACV